MVDLISNWVKIRISDTEEGKMKKKLLTIGMLLILMSGVVLVSCKNEPEEVSNNTVNVVDQNLDIKIDDEPDDIIVTEVIIEPLKILWEFEEKDTGEWQSEIPYFNPFMTEDAYSSVLQMNNDVHYIEYIDDYAALLSETVYGDYWELRAPFDNSMSNDENKQFLYDIESYIQSKNGMILGRYYDSLTFECLEDEVHWIGTIRLESEEFLIQMVRERLLKADETVTLYPEEYDEPFVNLVSYSTGTRFQTLHLTKEGGDVYLEIVNASYFGNYWRRYGQYIDFSEEYGDDFYINTIPYDAGRIQWSVNWDVENPPSLIRLTLEDQGAIPEVTHGEALGAIKVSAEYAGRIEAIATGEQFLTLDHDEYSVDNSAMDTTPDGDHIIYLPSGLWNVAVFPEGNALVEKYETMMVPVNTGQVTEVIIPNSVATKLKVTSGFEEKGLSIRHVIESQNTVKFRFTLLDDETKLILPSIENTLVYEGGTEGRILSIDPVIIPPSIVLLLDSSGSMSGQMTETLEAARTFIESLPDESKIQVIDFDTKPKLLEGLDKVTVLSNLDKIKVGGATTLYDAIIEGIELLQEDERPTLVVFTDGEDANLNDTAQGSDATKEEAIKSVEDQGIPIYTIGFGEQHDSRTLETFAGIAEGKYYAAKDQSVLKKVFDAINNKITNTYDLTYERPSVTSKSDIPVVSIVVDTSGSMGNVEEGLGERLSNVKFLLHKFVTALPKDTQLQLTQFNDRTSIVQTMTTDKTLILRGIGSLESGGSTDIEGSVETMYRTLKEQPSSKKVLVYITDAALGTSNAEPYFLDLLNEIHESDISVLWVGMGVDEYEHDFIMAADITGGEYIVTEDVDELQNKFDEILQEIIDAPLSQLVGVTLNVEKVNEVGEREVYTTSVLTELAPNKISEKTKLTETIEYKFSDVVKQYDQTTAKKVSGSSLPGRDIIISNRMDAHAIGHNDAAEIQVNEVFTIDKIDGVEPPSGYKFLSLDISVKNILPSQEVVVYPDDSAHPSSWVAGGNKGEIELRKIAYMIPNFSSHIYLTYNNKDTLPASTATWLMAEPLVVPGNYSLTIQPDQTQSGLLTFIVPDEVIDQTSLHFYDTNYGHINMPIIGVMTETLAIESLPLEVTSNLSDTFGLAITDFKHVEDIAGVVEMDDESTLRIVKGNFTSNMQALIDINPVERMKMRINTASGDFYIPVSPLTVMIPGGFIQPRMMAPGANNVVKWVFQIPESLTDYSSDLFVELFEEDKVVQISEGQTLSAPMNEVYEHEYFKLIVNNLVRVNGFKGDQGDFIIVDLTVEDIKDGYSTASIVNQLSVVLPEYFDTEEGEQVKDSESKGLGNFASNNGSGDYIRFAHYATEQLLFGMNDDMVIYDGTSRRSFVIFELPEENEGIEWQFYSPVVENLLLPIPNGDYETNLLVDSVIYEEDSYYEEQFTEAVSRAIAAYELSHPLNNETLEHGKVGLGDAVLSKNDVPVPMLSLYGTVLKEEINSIEKLISTFKTFKFIPSTGYLSPFEYTYSTEAFLIQEFGTEQDFANAAMELLSEMGYTVKPQLLRLTNRGQDLFTQLGNVDETSIDVIPGLSFKDHNNVERVLIIPFMAFADEVDNVVYVEASESIDHFSNRMKLTIELIGEYTERGMLTQFSDMSDALSGQTEHDYSVSELMFDQYLPLAMLSKDAIDIGIGINGQSARAYVLSADGEIYGDYSINPNHYEFDKIKLTFLLANNEEYIHVSEYDEKMTVDQIFMTASINAPDLSGDAAKYLEDIADQVFKAAENPNELSTLKWYARSMIANFIRKQSIHDQELAQSFELLIGRTTFTRVIVVSNQLNNGIMATSFDLVQSFDEIHFGDEEAKKSFNIMSGLYASSLEGEIVKNGYGLETVWSMLPEGTEMVVLDTYYTEEIKEELRAIGLEDDIVEYLSEKGYYVIMPKAPAIIDGKEKWAWLEINPTDYRTIAVLDDYSHGASVESAIIDAVTNAGQYVVGAFKGVETSVWSVAAFSLEESDYSIILKKAKALALGIVKNFDVKEGIVGGSVGGTISASTNVGPIKLSFDGSFNISQGVLGFNEGFTDGVKLYFDVAK